MSNWTLFSNHGHVLVCLSRDPEARLRDVAAAVGITERAVQKIVRDLQESGMISVSKQGRRNQYRIHRKAGLRHELEADSTIGGLLDFVSAKSKTTPVAKPPATEKPQASAKAPTKQEPQPASKQQTIEKPAVTEPTKSDKASADKTADDKDATGTGHAIRKKKVSKKSDAESDIEKQQGSLF